MVKNNIVHFFSGISLKMCEGKLDQDRLRSTRCLQSVTMLLHVICVMSFTLLKLRYKWIVDLDLFSLRIERYFVSFLPGITNCFYHVRRYELTSNEHTVNFADDDICWWSNFNSGSWGKIDT